MRALLFGSIGSIIETSELQRHAFNLAFKEYDLNWYWDQKFYRTLLDTSGGKQRISLYARAVGDTVDAERLHRSKAKHFHSMLETAPLRPRRGVMPVIDSARSHGFKIALCSQTNRTSIELLLARAVDISMAHFDLLTSAASGLSKKPDPAIFRFALKSLGVANQCAVSIEDNPAGVQSAMAAGIDTIGYPGPNTAHLVYPDAKWVARGDLFGQWLLAMSEIEQRGCPA